MIRNISVSRCLKSDFKAFEKINDNTFMLRWGMEGETDMVSEFNEETGKYTFTGEEVETGWCSYENGLYSGVFKTGTLDKVFEKSNRLPGMEELKAIGDGVGLSEEEILPWMKKHLLNAISKYDKSKNVEDFTIGGVHIWLNSDMRNKVRENLETAQRKGEEEVVLRYEGMSFPMTVVMGWQLYYAVLDYARATWNVTEENKAAAMAAGTYEALVAHEAAFKSNYPEKLSF